MPMLVASWPDATNEAFAFPLSSQAPVRSTCGDVLGMDLDTMVAGMPLADFLALRLHPMPALARES